MSAEARGGSVSDVASQRGRWSGVDVKSGEPAVLVLSFVVSRTAEEPVGAARADVTFRREPLPHSAGFSGTLHFACTGGDIRFEANNAQFTENYTRVPPRHAKFRVADEHASSLSAKAGDWGSGSTSSIRELSAEFVNAAQPELVAKKISPDLIEWSYDCGREAKLVRDYLNETLTLAAECCWESDSNGHRSVRCSACALDIALFGTGNRRFSGIKALALRAALRARGVAVPGPGPVYIERPI